MKKALLSFGLIALVAGAFSIQSCNKIKDEIANQLDPFNFSQQSFEITVPATAADSVNTGLVSSTINLQQYIDDNLPSGVSLGFDMIDKITLKKVTIAPADVSGFDNANNFTNFSDLFAIFNTNVGVNKNLTSILTFGSIDDVTANQYMPIVLEYNNPPNLKDYFNASGNTEVQYYIYGHLRRSTTHDVKVKVTVEYEITP